MADDQQDLGRISRNLHKMRGQGASDAEIKDYLSQEGMYSEGPEGAGINQLLGSLPPAQQQQPAPTGQGMTLDNIGRQIAKGVPVLGPLMDEGAAALDAVTHPLLGRGSPGETYSQRYNANVARERGIDQSFEQANPRTSMGLQIGGGLASGGALLKAAPGVGNVVFGNVGATLPQRMIAGGAAGAALGAASGAGSGEDAEGRLAEALKGGAIGGPLGAAAAPIASGIRSGVNAIRNWGATRGAAADLGAPASAVSRVAGNVAADELTPAIAAQRSAETGPEGMVMDAGRQLRGRAEAVATLPGTGQNTILNATEERVRGAAQRIGQELDATLGQSPNIVDLTNRIDAHYRRVLAPVYERVMTGHPQVWNQTLETLTSRPSVQRAIDNAVELAAEHGSKIQNPFIRGADGQLTLQPGTTPSLAFWDYVKKSLDSRINAFARNPDVDSAGKSSMGALLDTKRALVSQLDQITSGEYANARNLAAGKFEIKEALQTGLDLFQNRMLPEQFAEELRTMGQMERAAVAAGARRALERLREVSPANMSEGANSMYRELLQGGPHGDTAQKLRMLLGDQATEGLVAAAQRETGFRSVHDQVASNSRTATRQALQADMQTPGTPDMTVTGIANKLPMLPVQAAAGGMLERGTQRTREGIADLLTRVGPERDRVLSTLIDLNARRAARSAAAPQTDNSIAAALQATLPEQGASSRIPWLDLKSKSLARTLVSR